MINPIQMAACYTIVPLPLVLSSRRRKTEDWRAETDSWLTTTKPDLLIQVDIHLVGYHRSAGSHAPGPRSAP